MTLKNKSLSEKLTEITKPNDGNFQLLGFLKTGGHSGFIVIRLSGINGSNSKKGFGKRAKTGEDRRGFEIIETLVRERR